MSSLSRSVDKSLGNVKRPKFTFPRKTILSPRIPLALVPKSERLDRGLYRKTPVYNHNGRLIRASSVRNGNKLVERAAEVRRPHDKNKVRGWVAPKDRIERWTIGPGDKVRLLVGRPEDKYIDPSQGAAGGWRVYEVSEIALSRNEVRLKGLDSPAHNVPKPNTFDSMTQDEQNTWNRKYSRAPRQRKIAVSNLGLLVKENKDDPKLNEFARRVRAGRARWLMSENRWHWDRIAKVVRTDENGDKVIEELKVEWPMEDVKQIEAGLTETDAVYAAQSTLKMMSGSEISQHTSYAAQLFPTTLRAPPPSDKSFLDEWQTKHPDDMDERKSDMLDLLMPLYLAEELSPRFATHRTALAKKQRYLNSGENRRIAARAAVQEWKDAGEDRGLRQMMEQPEANLEGVPLKPRTAKEVAEVAGIDYDARVRDAVRESKSQVKKGFQWNYVSNVWEATPVSESKRRKQVKKSKKAARTERKLEGLQLKEGRNQVLPPWLKLGSANGRSQASA